MPAALALAYSEGDTMADRSLYGRRRFGDNEAPPRVDPSPGEPWLVVCAKPGKEREARWELSQQGFPNYLPMRAPEGRELLRHKDLPALPGYLFAQAHSSGRWRPILSTLGVRDIIWRTAAPTLNGDMGDHAPAWLTDAELHDFRRREVKGMIRVELADPFRVGAEVKAEMFGDFWPAIVMERRGPDYAPDEFKLLATVFGKGVVAVVAADKVRPQRG